jgi:hypothetical protein
MSVMSSAAEPTSPETRAEMIRLIDNLEKYPNDWQAGGARTKVYKWLSDAPDVSVNVCAYLLGDMNRYKDDEGGDMLMAVMFAEARYLLENPDKKTDDHEVHLAGLEGALRTYAAMKSDNPKFLIPPMENLVKLQREQKLSEHVSKGVAKCS